MKKGNFFIKNIPAVIYGENCDKGFIFVHGQCGNKEEAERFSKIAYRYGYQVMAVDLPEHGGRSDNAKFLPWQVIPELKEVLAYAKTLWQSVSIRATSIGAYFSLLAYANEDVKNIILVSPLVDMTEMIYSMMKNNGISLQTLEKEKTIYLPNGQVLSWEYLCFAKEHPVVAKGEKVAVLYATGDKTISRESIDKFVKKNCCALTLINGAEHWLHTDKDIALLESFERKFFLGE